jgi:hypothetical protein
MITGSHVCFAAINTSSERQVRYLKIVSLSTDGILSVTCKEAGLITLFTRHDISDTVLFIALFIMKHNVLNMIWVIME